MFWRSPVIEDHNRCQMPCFAYGAYVMLQRPALHRDPDAAYLFRYTGQQSFLLTAAEYTVVAHANKTLGQYMERKTPYKFAVRQSQQRFLAAMAVVLYREGDTAPIKVLDAMVANGDPVGIPAQVFDHL